MMWKCYIFTRRFEFAAETLCKSRDEYHYLCRLFHAWQLWIVVHLSRSLNYMGSMASQNANNMVS